jgi:hypothetical protein
MKQKQKLKEKNQQYILKLDQVNKMCCINAHQLEFA